MLGICFTNSALCRYFRKSVLPEDAGLEAVFTQTPTTRRKQTAARVRKYREKQQQM